LGPPAPGPPPPAGPPPRLLVNTNYDAATAAWFDLRWPLEGE
jgi:hypothetical protein